ncbi:hypothetical protein [Streptomyces sp. MZ04]|uniref:DoxX family protein n=1 Tax=Streptomyces sp. MZ04 TaxID=2559236 RepID=UPI00107EC4C0|nr:hypothetical protein [Streptomyces sp. MZ04]TGB08862.1 hypothetical protein E2651_17770 [Streptomyces sp. MZ04]
MSDFAALALAAFLTVTAVTHFLFPGYFRSLVPRWLPSPAALVTASAVAELATAALLFIPATRMAGGWTAVALLSAFQVSHLHAAFRTRARTGFLNSPWGVAARLAVNAAYIGWALAVTAG